MHAIRTAWRDRRRPLLTVVVVLVVAIAALTLWLIGRSPQTIRIEGTVVIGQQDHYNVYDKTGECIGTRTAFAGGADLFVEPDNAESSLLELEQGEIHADGSCVFAFSGEVADAEHYSVSLDRYLLDSFSGNAVRVTESGGDELLRIDLLADSYDPWTA